MKSNSIKRIVGEAEEELPRTKYSQTLQRYHEVVSQLKIYLKRLEELPIGDEIKQAALELDRVIQRFDIKRQLSDEEFRKATGFKLTQAIGPMATRELIKRAVVKATGWRNWRLRIGFAEDEGDESEGDIAAWLHDNFGIGVDPTQMVRYQFTRDTDNRSALWLIELIVFPGHIYVHHISTDRVDSGGDVVTSLKGLEHAITSFGGTRYHVED